MNEQRLLSFSVLRSVLEPLRPFFDDPTVVEIMINGPGSVWVESSGKMARHSVSLPNEIIHTVIRQIAHVNGRGAVEGTETGIVDAEIPVSAVCSQEIESRANMRIAAVMSPTSLHGHALCIRKHSPVVFSLLDYELGGSFTPNPSSRRAQRETFPGDFAAVKSGGVHLAEFLRWMLRTNKTFLVSGATGSGKTTFFKTLIQELPVEQRILTIEDTPELVITVPNFV